MANTSIPLASALVGPEAEGHDQQSSRAGSAEGGVTPQISRTRRPRLSLRYRPRDFATDL